MCPHPHVPGQGQGAWHSWGTGGSEGPSHMALFPCPHRGDFIDVWHRAGNPCPHEEHHSDLGAGNNLISLSPPGNRAGIWEQGTTSSPCPHQGTPLGTTSSPSPPESTPVIWEQGTTSTPCPLQGTPHPSDLGTGNNLISLSP